jgi:ABC-type proline/glycine betaine transport system ATPase subunit
VLRIVAFVINEMIDKLIERKSGDVRLQNHCESVVSNVALRTSARIWH